MMRLDDKISLHDHYDVVMARQRVREMARNLGFTLTDQTRIATAVSEVARQALANRGSVSLSVVSDGARRGIECTCRGCDPQQVASPVPMAAVPGGLPGVERLVDDFLLERHDDGYIIVMRKWQRAVA